MKPVFLLAAASVILVACADTRTSAPAAPAAASAPPTVLPAAPQPSAEVRDTQERLQRLGFYDGAVDGLWGPETRDAVARFQRSQGLPVTARLDEATLRGIESAPAAVRLSDETDVRAVQNRLRQLGFYDGSADGVWGPETQVALERFQRERGLNIGEVTGATLAEMGLDPAEFRTAAAAPEGMGTADALEPEVVASIQRRLRSLGFYDGGVDGIWGPNTQEAVARFQQSRGLEASGVLNPVTASALGLDPNNLAASVPR